MPAAGTPQDRALRAFGVTYERLVDLVGDNTNSQSNPILRAYLMQKSGAKSRGIAWQFNLDEWWSVWSASGRWSQRGSNAGNYVMARHRDLGPYGAANVYICTMGDNARESAQTRLVNPRPDHAARSAFAAWLTKIGDCGVADLVGVSPRAARSWREGQRTPRGPVISRLLAVNPSLVVADILHVGRSPIQERTVVVLARRNGRASAELRTYNRIKQRESRARRRAASA